MAILYCRLPRDEEILRMKDQGPQPLIIARHKRERHNI